MLSWLVVSAIVFLLLIKQWGLGLFVSAATVLFVLCERQRLSLFRRRHDHRDLWMDAFYPDDRRHVDALLSAVCDAFLIPRRYRFRLRPSDDSHGFYRRNVRGQLGDSLEYVFLSQSLERFVGVLAGEALAARPCTVGSLVRLAAKPRKTTRTEEGTVLDRDVARQVCEIVADVCGVRVEEIGLSMRLREDLNLLGDDVDDLLLALQEKFGTDWSSLDFHKYLKEEPHLLWLALFLYRGLVHSKWGNGTITVEHLIKVVQCGRWMDPDQAL